MEKLNGENLAKALGLELNEAFEISKNGKPVGKYRICADCCEKWEEKIRSWTIGRMDMINKLFFNKEYKYSICPFYPVKGDTYYFVQQGDGVLVDEDKPVEINISVTSAVMGEEPDKDFMRVMHGKVYQRKAAAEMEVERFKHEYNAWSKSPKWQHKPMDGQCKYPFEDDYREAE